MSPLSVRNGREIVVDPCSEASPDRNVRGLSSRNRHRGVVPPARSAAAACEARSAVGGRAVAFAERQAPAVDARRFLSQACATKCWGTMSAWSASTAGGGPSSRARLAAAQAVALMPPPVGVIASKVSPSRRRLGEIPVSTGTRRGTDPLRWSASTSWTQACGRRTSAACPDGCHGALLANTYRGFLLAPMGFHRLTWRKPRRFLADRSLCG